MYIVFQIYSTVLQLVTETKIVRNIAATRAGIDIQLAVTIWSATNKIPLPQQQLMKLNYEKFKHY